MEEFIESKFNVKISEMKMWDFEFLIRNLIILGKEEIDGVPTSDIIDYLKKQEEKLNINNFPRDRYVK
jgi:hypothetical protein